MAKHKRTRTTIEINGSLYDPHTGREVGGSGTPVKPASQSIDGVIGGSTIQSQPPAGSELQPLAVPAPKPSASRPAPKHAKRPVAKSQTLMRSGLQKPPGNPQPNTDKSRESLLQASLAKRAERAKQIQQNRLIQRFNPDAQPAEPSRPAVPAKRQPLEVAEPAKQYHAPKHHETPQHTFKHHAAKRTARHTGHHTAKPKPNSIKDFEKALRSATSHLEKMPKQPRKRRFKPKASKANIAMASVAAVLLMGFFAWQNVPNLQMRLAASRAGISASLPGYSPAGYSVDGGIQSEPGRVTVSFSSQANEQAFTIIEEASGWDDEALYARYVEPRDGQTYQSEGKTIYLIDNSSATWVGDGIWYRIDGSSDLTTDQLQRIANSL